MKKIIALTVMLLSLQAQAQAQVGYSLEATAIPFFSLAMTGEDLSDASDSRSYKIEQAQNVQADIEVYEATGEVTNSLYHRVKGLKSQDAFKDLSNELIILKLAQAADKALEEEENN